jgi:lipoprotein-anchoring transpeptidase ErfK/SrfK
MSSLANDGDTIFVDVSHLIDLEASEPDPPASPPEAEAAANPPLPTETAVPLILPETNLVPFEPLRLIGPERPPTEPEVSPAEASPEVPQPVDNLLLAHQPAYPGEKWIEVDVTSQQVTAWEGNVPVFSFAASTGLQYTPTVLGEFHIYWKLESTLMSGPGYYLPDVPYTMYFYKGYALHGTYWHENFGQPMSHGCVNLETGNAKKLFEWAGPAIPPGQTQVTASADNPGTLVVVHE